jgi:formylglycine-generating enzyme required for sulfatase activity
MVFIPAGDFTMGSDHQRPEERFSRRVHLDGFWIDRTEVTNAQFTEFVAATGYVTLAERGIDPKTRPDLPKELTVPGSIVFVPPTKTSGRMLEWFQYVPGANWRHPEGPGSSIEGLHNHPVVHIAYEDALAYARWRGRSLPTEAQFEYASRGGTDGTDYAWGNEVTPDGKYLANTWQGIFPIINTGADGYIGRAPVGCFEPNGYGLFDMIGNVWEWTSDWFRPGHDHDAVSNPTGPSVETIRAGYAQSPAKVIKGGSHLCANNFCARYRPTARQPQEVDLSAGHIGFRTVLNQGHEAHP